MTYYNIINGNPSAGKGYGVRVVKEKIINNISDDLSVVEILVDICNRLQVDFEHFEDVLENYAGDYKTF